MYRMGDVNFLTEFIRANVHDNDGRVASFLSVEDFGFEGTVAPHDESDPLGIVRGGWHREGGRRGYRKTGFWGRGCAHHQSLGIVKKCASL